VIDVRRDTINFRGEGDWSSGNMNEIAVVKIGGTVRARWFASARQWLREGWRRRVRGHLPG
jgi:hypothetical protein